MTDLARTQQLVWQLITAPAGVEDGIRRLRQQRALEGDDLSFLVAPGRKLDPTEQLGIYADMYFYRLRDCLAEDFPRLASHLGEVGFHNLVTDYLWAHPSEHPSLRELGRRLPGFLARHELAATHPGAADLARLEWARVDLFDAADAPPLAREELLRRAAQAPDRFAPALVPAHRRLRVRAGVLPLWREPGTPEPATTDPAEVGVLVWRRGHSVLHRSLPPDEECCLELLAAGRGTLAALGEALLAEHAEHDASPRLAELLARWTHDELLTRGE